MKRGISQYQPHIIGILLHQVLHDGVEGTARLTGGIEEFDNRHRGTLRAKHGRVHADHTFGLLIDLLLLRVLHTLLIAVHTKCKECKDHSENDNDGHFFGIHFEDFRR